MTKFATGAALAAIATFAMPAAAQAQALSPATIVVVDMQRISVECTACKSATQQLQQQAQQIEQRAQQLRTPLETEAQTIQTAAQNNSVPQAQLQQQVQALQTKQQQAQQEIMGRQQTLARNQAFVAQQIQERVYPIIRTLMQQKGASLAIPTDATLAIAPTLDITAEVLAQLNTQLPSVNVNAPAAPAQQQQPAGR